MILVPAPTPYATVFVGYTSAPLTWWSVELLWLGRRHTRKVTECELRRAKVVGFSVPSTAY